MTTEDRKLDEQAHALEVIYLAISEVQTINASQETAKNWAMRTIREQGYELRQQARLIRNSTPGVAPA